MSTSTDTGPRFYSQRRWYDQKPELSQCVSLLETFPDEIRTIIADGLVYLAEREFEAHLMLSSLKSLGAEKIMGIYKSKNKRRSFDQDPVFHKAMNYFYILSPPNRLFMAKLATDLVNYIYQYFESCKTYRQPSSQDEIQNLTKTYLEGGGDEARKMLESIQKQFRFKLQSAPDQAAIQEDESGMRLHKRP